MHRGQSLLLLAGFLGATAPAAFGQPLTEEQALDRMRAGHPYLRALRLGVREIEAGERERGLLANPTVGYTREDAGGASDDFLLFSQELPLRGRVGLLREAAGHAVTAAEARAEASRLAFEARLRLAFTDLLLAQEQVAVLDGGLQELVRLVEVLRAREREGEGSRFDRLRTEREVADVETDREAAVIERLMARARLAAFLEPGTAADRLFAVGRLLDAAPVPGPDASLARALARRADYRALTLGETRWATERRAAERLRLPAAAVTAGLKRSGSAPGRESGYVVAATVGVPLFNRGQAQVARAEAARAKTDAERLALRTRIRSEVRAAHAAASRYRALAERYRVESVEPAAELAAIATAAYEEGEYGILELLDAHRVVVGAGLRLLELSATARRAGIDLDLAAGGEAAP
jgi:cobalt-zinc-cadmium efflux system outer membrane protein